MSSIDLWSDSLVLYYMILFISLNKQPKNLHRKGSILPPKIAVKPPIRAFTENYI